jgi:hypothetical protein
VLTDEVKGMTSSNLVEDKTNARNGSETPVLTHHTVTQHTPPPRKSSVVAVRSNSQAPANSLQTSSNDQSDQPKLLTRADELNFYGRWIENGRYIGTMTAAIVDREVHTDNKDFHQQLDDSVDKMSGLVIGTLLHKIFESKYKKIDTINPLYREVKTLAAAATQVAIIAADLLPLPQAVASAFFVLPVIIFTVPYWLYSEYYVKPKKAKSAARAVNPLISSEMVVAETDATESVAAEAQTKKSNQYTRMGTEGWSKYAKTSLVFGMYIGEVVGNIVSFVMRGDYLRNILVYGAVGSVVAFIAGVVMVPVINRFFGNKLITSKDNFRNNYVRSGITLGIAVGAVIGFGLALVFPAIGIPVGMAVCSAFGSVLGGVLLGYKGRKITLYLQDNWKVEKNTDNSWDYATRNLSYFLGFVGAAIGFFIPIPGGSLVGAAVGTAIGSTLGWGGGLLLIRQARKNCNHDYPAETLPWTQRIANGTMIGSIIGITLGIGAGFLIGGPAGAVLGASLGFSAGAVLGGVAYVLYDKTARLLLRQYFTGKELLPHKPPVIVSQNDRRRVANELVNDNQTAEKPFEENLTRDFISSTATISGHFQRPSLTRSLPIIAVAPTLPGRHHRALSFSSGDVYEPVSPRTYLTENSARSNDDVADLSPLLGKFRG